MDEIKAETVIAPEVEITGTLKTAGSVQFNGKLSGDLVAAGDAAIGKEARVTGNLEVNCVSIAGRVEGNITAKDRIEMQATAHVQGDIKAKRLTVEEGVTFVGRSEVNPSGEPVKPAATAQDAPAAAASLPAGGVPPKASELGEGKGASLFGKK